MTRTLTTSGDRPLELVWRNVTTRYVSIGVDGVIGLLLLPFTIAHLGASEYGLWALATSVTWFFGVLDLGYGGALARFIARYRAWQDRTALNEIVSTVGCVYAALGAICFFVTLAIAWWVEALFNIAPNQVATAQSVLLIVGAYLSIRFPFAIFGGVVYAFQRSYRNNLASIVASVGVALVTVLMLRAGHGLVGLVAATTAVRALSLGAFTWNAYRVFPELQVSPWLFRRNRLHEVTGFSVYMFILDCAAKLNYSADALVIGAMLNTAAVAVWTVGQRVAQFTQQLTGQITDALFPVVVDSDAAQRQERLQAILIQGTRVSLAFAAPVCVGLIVLADPLIDAWMGARFSASVLPTRLLLGVVLVRAATSSANVILKGAGRHKLLAWTNASAAIANVVLSVSLVGPLGLTGVAIGTFVPVTLSALLVLYPAACRRVGLGLRRAVADAIWPAAWPAAVTAGVLWIERAFHAGSMIEIAVMLAIGAIVYAGLFIGLAIARDERRVYLLKLQTLLIARREPPPTPRLVAD